MSIPGTRDEEPKIIALRGWQIAASRLIHWLLIYPFRLHQRLHAKAQNAWAPSPVHQLEQFEQSVASQRGVDGILREIFYRIGSGRRFFVEFGVEDGYECNTALLASRYRWSGLYIEANPQDVERLRKRWSARSDITIRQAFITAENIASLFAQCGVPSEPDLLSIDIDGNDYWVWKALAQYRPRAVVIEYNASYPPPRRWIMAYNPEHRWGGTTYFGASLSALHDLGSRLGYALLGTDTQGLNAFFLRRDLLAESGFAEATPQQAYHPPRYGILRLPYPLATGPSVGTG
jgi:hypothetical protein